MALEEKVAMLSESGGLNALETRPHTDQYDMFQALQTAHQDDVSTSTNAISQGIHSCVQNYMAQYNHMSNMTGPTGLGLVSRLLHPQLHNHLET